MLCSLSRRMVSEENVVTVDHLSVGEEPLLVNMDDGPHSSQSGVSIC